MRIVQKNILKIASSAEAIVLLLSIIAMVFFKNGKAQTYTGRKLSSLYEQLNVSQPDSVKTKLLLEISSLYLDKRGEAKKNMDSSLLLAQQASYLSQKINFINGKDEADFLMGVVYIKSHQDDKLGKLLESCSIKTKVRVMLEMIRYNTYFEGASEPILTTALSYAQQSLELSNMLGSVKLQAETLLQFANIYYYKHEIIKGRNYYLQAAEAAKKGKLIEVQAEIFSQMSTYIKLSEDEVLIKEIDQLGKELIPAYYSLKDTLSVFKIQKLIATGYDQLSYFNIYKGRLNLALGYSLQMVKMLERENNLYNIEMPYQTISKIYFELGEMQQAISYNKMALDIVSKKGEILDGTALKTVTKAYIGLHQPGEALAFLEEVVSKGGYDDARNKRLINESMGNCYFALGRYDKAEKYYLESLKSVSGTNGELFFVLCLPLGKLYVYMKQYDKARFYLTKLIGEHTETVPLFVKRDAHSLLFKADSATSNFVGAIQHLQKYQAINDSIFNQKRNAQLDELMLQYETEKKDKNLILQQQDIQLLTKRSELQNADLRRTRFSRNVFIGAMIVLFAILGMVYNRYRFKQRTNKLLEAKQQEINRTNKHLRQLNDDQQRLLIEKEWLVKEIHHRVKNNLQMIISLLNAQTEFLDNPSALHAIQESRERMQAIALIHKKLYEPGNNEIIDMNSYICEMVGYIENSLPSDTRISFVTKIDNIQLDVSQALPVGLILNEAVTNAVKYAFLPDKPGNITISMHYLKEENILLQVTDNGKGLPGDFNQMDLKSLGLQLMKLFTEQIDGEINFKNNNGVEIRLLFKQAYTNNKPGVLLKNEMADGENINS